MTIHLRLGGFRIENGCHTAMANVGCRVYEEMRAITTFVHAYKGDSLIGVLKSRTSSIEAILFAVARGHPIDIMGQEIDLHTQIQELGVLINSIRTAEMAIRGFLVSDEGQVRWNNGNVLIEGKIVNIAEQCTGLTDLVERMQAAQIALRLKIDAENAAIVTPALDPHLVKDVIGIIGQYMN